MRAASARQRGHSRGCRRRSATRPRGALIPRPSGRAPTDTRRPAPSAPPTAFFQVDEPAAGIVREPDLRPADSRTPAPSGVQACFCRRWRYRVRRSAGCLPRYAFAPGGREPLPLDLAETRAKLAGMSRWNEHRDDRARGRLQNPLAQNDVRTGKPSHRWEARWNKWKGQSCWLSRQ